MPPFGTTFIPGNISAQPVIAPSSAIATTPMMPDAAMPNAEPTVQQGANSLEEQFSVIGGGRLKISLGRNPLQGLFGASLSTVKKSGSKVGGMPEFLAGALQTSGAAKSGRVVREHLPIAILEGTFEHFVVTFKLNNKNVTITARDMVEIRAYFQANPEMVINAEEAGFIKVAFETESVRAEFEDLILGTSEKKIAELLHPLERTLLSFIEERQALGMRNETDYEPESSERYILSEYRRDRLSVGPIQELTVFDPTRRYEKDIESLRNALAFMMFAAVTPRGQMAKGFTWRVWDDKGSFCMVDFYRHKGEFRILQDLIVDKKSKMLRFKINAKLDVEAIKLLLERQYTPLEVAETAVDKDKGEKSQYKVNYADQMMFGFTEDEILFPFEQFADVDSLTRAVFMLTQMIEVIHEDSNLVRSIPVVYLSQVIRFANILLGRKKQDLFGSGEGVIGQMVKEIEIARKVHRDLSPKVFRLTTSSRIYKGFTYTYRPANVQLPERIKYVLYNRGDKASKVVDEQEGVVVGLHLKLDMDEIERLGEFFTEKGYSLEKAPYSYKPVNGGRRFFTSQFVVKDADDKIVLHIRNAGFMIPYQEKEKMVGAGGLIDSILFKGLFFEKEDDLSSGQSFGLVGEEKAIAPYWTRIKALYDYNAPIFFAKKSMAEGGPMNYMKCLDWAWSLIKGKKGLSVKQKMLMILIELKKFTDDRAEEFYRKSDDVLWLESEIEKLSAAAQQ